MNRPAFLMAFLLAAAPALDAHAERDRARSGESPGRASSSSSAGHSRGAGARHDHDEAREALRRGKVMPLTAILAIAGRREHGQVIAVELETERGRLNYKIDVLNDAGRMARLRIDARTGEILSVNYR
jgi:uncharacterized membrane protein YkoI